MSLLSDEEILEEIKAGSLKIEPFDKEYLGPDSLDIRLGNEVLIAKAVGKTLDPLSKSNPDFFEKKKIDGAFTLEPGQFILANTLEKVSLSNRIAAQIEGRSSLGRYGIMVHMTAGIIHAGFGSKSPSTLTLEIYSVNPNSVLLHEGMKIAQLSFFKLNRDVGEGYDSKKDSKYVGQLAPERSKVYLDK